MGEEILQYPPSMVLFRPEVPNFAELKVSYLYLRKEDERLSTPDEQTKGKASFKNAT